MGDNNNPDTPSADAGDLLPGVKGTDYTVVRYGGKYYVVYSVKLPNGNNLRMMWSVDKADLDVHGIGADEGNPLTKSQFKALNYFGDASEIQRRGLDEHPFKKFLKHLQELYGPVSWLQNREYMSIMLMGYAERWSPDELNTRLRRTDWYQNRSAYQRQWESEFTKADRRDQLDSWTSRVYEALREIYGTEAWSDHGIDQKKVRNVAEQIASGQWGNPDEAFQTWITHQTHRAAGIEGTQAWIEQQLKKEQQREFLNRPEDMYEKIRQDAFSWLGPRGRPDQETLRRWSQDLVSGRRSQADWSAFLRQQATALYPYLGDGEMWQDRAGSYKQIAEQLWGRPIRWEDPILQKIGGVDDKGNPTGAPLSYDQFQILARKDQRFWRGPTAREEGFGLFNLLNDVFNGVPTGG